MTTDMEQYGYITTMAPFTLEFEDDIYGFLETDNERKNYAVRGIDCPAAKDAYMTYEDARRALRQRSLQEQKDKRIYKCDICGYWHFTTKPGSHRRHCKGYNRSRGREEMHRMCSLITPDSLKKKTTANVPKKALRVSYNLLSNQWADWMTA